MTTKRDFIDEIKTKIIPQSVVYANLKVEVDIVQAITHKVFDSSVLVKRFHDLLSEDVETKSFTYWGTNAYDYESIANEIVEDSIFDDICNFTEYCYQTGKYKEFLEEALDYPKNEDVYSEAMNEFCIDFRYDENLPGQVNDIELYKLNPKISDIYEKYIGKITEYNTARKEYDTKQKQWIENTRTKASKINNPKLNQKLTRNDKDLLKQLKRQYSNEEIRLMIWAGMLLVSNTVATDFGEIRSPYDPPHIADFVRVDKKIKYPF